MGGVDRSAKELSVEATADEIALRLRLLRHQWRAVPCAERDERLARTLHEHVASLEPRQRLPVLAALQDRLPTWETRAEADAGRASAAEQPVPGRGLDDATSLVDRLLELWHNVPASTRSRLVVRLQEGGIVDRSASFLAPDSARRLRREFGVPDSDSIDLDRLAALTCSLAAALEVLYHGANSDRLQQLYERAGVPMDEIKSLRNGIGKALVKAAPLMSIDRAVGRLAVLSSALLAGWYEGSERFLRELRRRFEPGRIKSQLDERSGGWRGDLLTPKETRYWREYERIALSEVIAESALEDALRTEVFKMAFVRWEDWKDKLPRTEERGAS